jgi:hypothetical protein
VRAFKARTSTTLPFIRIFEFNILHNVINHVKFVSFETGVAYATLPAALFASCSLSVSAFFGKHRKSA